MIISAESTPEFPVSVPINTKCSSQETIPFCFQRSEVLLRRKSAERCRGTWCETSREIRGTVTRNSSCHEGESTITGTLLFLLTSKSHSYKQEQHNFKMLHVMAERWSIHL